MTDVSDQVAQYVIRARDEASSVFDKLAGGLSNLSGSMAAMARAAGPVGTIATTLATIGTAAAIGAVKLADEVEQLDRLASTSGVSVDKLQAMQQVLKESGGDADGLPRALVKLNKAIQDSDPLLSGLGIKTKDTFEAFMQLSTAISQSSDAKLRDEVSMRLLGKAGADLIPDLIAIQSNLGSMADRLEQAGVLMKGQVLENARELGNEMDVLSTNWDIAMKRIQSVTVPVASIVVSAFNDMWSAISGPSTADFDRRIQEATNAIARLKAEAERHGDPNWNQNTLAEWERTLARIQGERIQFLKPDVTTGPTGGQGDRLASAWQSLQRPSGVSAFDIASRGWAIGNPKLSPTDQLNASISAGAESSKKALQSMGKVLEELPVPALKLTDAGIKAMQSIELWEQTTQHFAYSVAADMQSVGAELLIGSTNIRAAWHELMKSILNDITSSAAEYGVGLLLDFIPIPGVDKLGDFRKNGFTAQSATAGGTNVFNINTLNAKDMVQEIVSPTGSIRRANDYVRAVSRAGR
jgi:hypothetical protein